MTGVRATYWQSLVLLMVMFFDSETIVDFLRRCVIDWGSDESNILVKTLASWSAHSLRTLLVTPSGLALFLGSSALSVYLRLLLHEFGVITNFGSF